MPYPLNIRSTKRTADLPPPGMPHGSNHNVKGEAFSLWNISRSSFIGVLFTFQS